MMVLEIENWQSLCVDVYMLSIWLLFVYMVMVMITMLWHKYICDTTWLIYCSSRYQVPAPLLLLRELEYSFPFLIPLVSRCAQWDWQEPQKENVPIRRLCKSLSTEYNKTRSIWHPEPWTIVASCQVRYKVDEKNENMIDVKSKRKSRKLIILCSYKFILAE